MNRVRPGISQIVAAVVTDAVLVLLFVVIGRSSHQEALTIAGIAQTFWPFLAALAAAWLLTLAWRHPVGPIVPGVPIWLITVAGAMLLRWAGDQGTALPFVVVACVVLLIFLVGWRVLSLLLRGVRVKRAAR